MLPGMKHRIKICRHPATARPSFCRPVRLGDQGLIGNIDPVILKADSIMAVQRFPINIADSRAVRERTTQPLPDWSLLNHALSSGWPVSWASAGEQSSRKIGTVRTITGSLLSKATLLRGRSGAN
jgi:hypothetical protein